VRIQHRKQSVNERRKDGHACSLLCPCKCGLPLVWSNHITAKQHDSDRNQNVDMHSEKKFSVSVPLRLHGDPHPSKTAVHGHRATRKDIS